MLTGNQRRILRRLAFRSIISHHELSNNGASDYDINDLMVRNLIDNFNANFAAGLYYTLTDLGRMLVNPHWPASL